MKNAPGAPTDSPDTARALVTALNTRRLEAAGGLVRAAPSASESLLEISPLKSYAGEGLESFAGVEVQLPALISARGELHVEPQYPGARDREAEERVGV